MKIRDLMLQGLGWIKTDFSHLHFIVSIRLSNYTRVCLQDNMGNTAQTVVDLILGLQDIL